MPEKSGKPICQNVTPRKAKASWARKLGMRTLREDGLRKAAAGTTTLAEVLANTVIDEASDN